jgi:hypothetical protein
MKNNGMINIAISAMALSWQSHLLGSFCQTSDKILYIIIIDNSRDVPIDCRDKTVDKFHTPISMK